MIPDFIYNYSPVSRLIDHMITRGREAKSFELTGRRVELFSRKMVEVVLDNGYTLIFYKSLGLGTGSESTDEWVPTPSIDLIAHWIVKKSYLDELGNKVNPKLSKYDVPIYQEIANYLKNNEDEN
jgi:hypothetical protein